MKRREFIVGSARLMGTAWLVSRALGRIVQALPALPRKFTPSETVTLGQSGILPVALAATAPAIASILIGMTLVFNQEDG